MIGVYRWKDFERDFYSRRSDYFLIDGTIPVRRFRAHQDGLVAGAIAPDPATGDLVLSHRLLARIARGEAVEAITEEEFDLLTGGRHGHRLG